MGKGVDETPKRLGLTGKTYVWIAAQAAIGSSLDAPDEFPVGMLGVHFRTGLLKFRFSKKAIQI